MISLRPPSLSFAPDALRTVEPLDPEARVPPSERTDEPDGRVQRQPPSAVFPALMLSVALTLCGWILC